MTTPRRPTHRRALSLAAGLALSAACARAPAAGEAGATALAAYEPAQVPTALAPALWRAEAATKALQQRLGRRLQEVAEDGPRAVAVCREEAPVIAAEVSSNQGVAVGRTSHRLRSPANAPRPWAAPFVAAAAGKKAADVKPVVVDLGDRLGYLRPIGLAGGCLGCHGPAEGLSPNVKSALAAGYPADRATGFAEGDLRGWFWAEVVKQAPAGTP